jgi:hypothetical protein
MGSIPTPAMIFLNDFYHEETAPLSPLRGTERERERIYLINGSFPLLNINK